MRSRRSSQWDLRQSCDSELNVKTTDWYICLGHHTECSALRKMTEEAVEKHQQKKHNLDGPCLAVGTEQQLYGIGEAESEQLAQRDPERKMMKVVNLKQAILQAWKERWSDYQWAVNMKKFFPKGTTWDILNLAGSFYAAPFAEALGWLTSINN
ncbi:Mediator of RNA polymerase II transcription subunit 24 [Varanus komodoensis]|nr:Mediator of RNA polymerase II transcription subunit 24 [Varanus komodoensis]